MDQAKSAGINERKPAGAGAERARKGGAMLLIDPVGALAFFGFKGLDGESGLFHRAGHETADRVLLPAHLLHDLLEGGSVLPLEHGHDLSGLAAFTRAAAFLCVGALGAFRSEEHTSELQSHSFISYA